MLELSPQLLEEKHSTFLQCVLQIFEQFVGQCRQQLARSPWGIAVGFFF